MYSMLGDSSSDQINESRYLQGPFPVEVQYSLKLDISKVAQAGSEGSKSLAELLYGKAL